MHGSAVSRKLLLAGFGVVFAIACVISTTTRPSVLRTSGISTTAVKSPIKAHLRDGAVIVFPSGATVGNGMVSGAGRRFGALRSDSQDVRQVALDSVLGVEVYERTTNPGRTLVYGTVTLAASLVGSALLAVALFGSCPTVYGDSAGSVVLQAESFSNSIAPLLARRDVDRMHVAADRNGVIRLSVRNEAMETHHIDHLELVELRHGSSELALPTPKGAPIAVSEIERPGSLRDAAGRDVGAVLAIADEVAFSTDAALLDRAIAGGPTEDHLDITVAKKPGRDKLALVLRARSSLLSTAILYDYMLGRPGASALDWLAHDLSRIATLAQIAQWYAGNFGMRVEVRDGETWRPVARLLDFGPAAWRDVGVVVPALGQDSVRVRLSFAADEFRVDRLAVGWGVSTIEPRLVSVTRAYDNHGEPRDDMVRMLARADDRDVETHPGDQFSIEFDVGAAAPATRTYMLAAHGYYTEWLRAGWMMAATDSVPFSTSRAPIREVLRSWRASKDTLERQFFARRVPVM